jgi:peptide/nickel transport system substrate-binding protein
MRLALGTRHIQSSVVLRLCILLTIQLFLAECHRVGLQTGNHTLAWGAPHELRIGIVSDPNSLNPLLVWGQTPIDLTTLYTETLVTLNSKNQLVPLLATRVPTRANGDISSDGLTITYRLRHDNRFADGVPLTSRDVAFTYKAIMDARNPVSSAEPYHQIIAVDTSDPYTVRIHLRRRWAAAVSELFAASDFAFGILPAHVFANNPDIAKSQWNQLPFGSGPFRVVAWRHGDQIILEPNPFARRRPHLEKIIVKIVPDRNSLFIALETHEIDTEDILTLQQVRQVQAMPGIRLVRTPMNDTDFLSFQTQRFPTDDPRVRRAIIEAIDREALRKTIYLGLEDKATTEIPPVLWAHDYSIGNLPFDPHRAAADLDAAGWKLQGGLRTKDGRPLEIVMAYVGTNGQAQRLSTEVQFQLKSIGIRTILRGYPSTLIYAPASSGGIYQGGRFNLSYGSWYGGSDPEASETSTCEQRPPRGANFAFWCNREYDDLYSFQRTNDDTNVRRRAFFGMQRLLHNGYVLDCLVYSADYIGVNPGLVNFHPNMLYEFWNSEDWDVRVDQTS